MYVHDPRDAAYMTLTGGKGESGKDVSSHLSLTGMFPYLSWKGTWACICLPLKLLCLIFF